MTREDIIAAIRKRDEHDVADTLPFVEARYSRESLSEMEWRLRNGTVSQVHWEAYCYLWRNLGTGQRLSSECLGYDLGGGRGDGP